MKKAFVLLSGGLDSTTCLYKAIFDYSGEDDRYDVYKLIDNNHQDHGVNPITWVEAVSMDYGQRHSKEMEYAAKTCEILGIKHTILPLGGLLADKNTMLTQSDIEIPSVSYDDLPSGVSPTYVPFRNGTMLSVLAAYTQKWINEQNIKWLEAARKVRGEVSEEFLVDRCRMNVSAGIYFGAHAEDAANWAYPDCTPEFIGAMANAIFIGCYQQVRLHTPLMSLKKSEIVELGDKLGVPFSNTWSCYKGEEIHCGVCPTCRSRKQAFWDAGVADPTIYAE
jgi:7-cyano-7-deazaguanine synthase